MNIKLTLLLVVSLNTFATDLPVNPPVINPAVTAPQAGIPISHDLMGSGHGYVTWYLKLNIKELKRSGLINLVGKKKINFSKQSAIEMNTVIPDFIDDIYLYGNHLKRSGDITLMLSGGFSDLEIINLIKEKLYTIDGVPQLKQVKNINSRGNDVYVFELLNASGRHKKKYAARLVEGSFVFTNNLPELRLMLKMAEIRFEFLNKHQKLIEEKNDLMVLSINTQLAQKSMDLNLDSDEYVMKSQLFNKATNIVATMHLENSQLNINGALVSKNLEIAEQLKKIINGVVAYNTLSDDTVPNIQSKLLSKLTVNREDKVVFVSTNIVLPKQEQVK